MVVPEASYHRKSSKPRFFEPDQGHGLLFSQPLTGIDYKMPDANTCEATSHANRNIVEVQGFALQHVKTTC